MCTQCARDVDECTFRFEKDSIENADSLNRMHSFTCDYFFLNLVGVPNPMDLIAQRF